jgi:O-antigen/teichoic acid export membrane protein
MARVALADATTGAAAVLAAALAGWSVAGVLLARGAASIAVSAACLALTRGEGAGRAVAMRDLGPVAGPLALSALLIAVQTRAGHLVTMSLAGPVTGAALAAASRVTEVLGVLPEGALLALFPRMAAAPAAAATLAARAARLLAAVVLVPILVLSVAGGWVMRTLFGPGFEAAGGAAAILAWTALLSVTGGVVLHALVAGGRQRSLAVANVVAAAGGVALQLVLVGRFGLAGAAAATLATAVLGQATLLAMPSTRAAVVSVWQAVVPLAVLALVIALATAATRTDLLGAGVAVAAYVALALATGLVDARDVGALRAAATRRG